MAEVDRHHDVQRFEALASHLADAWERRVLTSVLASLESASLAATDVVELAVEPGGGGAPASISVRPSNPTACGLLVQIDDGELITIICGRHQIPLEIYSDDAADLVSEIGRVIHAIVRGGYKEQVKKEGERTRAIVQIKHGDVKVQLSYNTLRTRFHQLPKDGWQETVYAPYSADAE